MPVEFRVFFLINITGRVINYSFSLKVHNIRIDRLGESHVNLLATASPELVFLAGGMPNPNLFPFKSAVVSLADGTKLTLNEQLMKSALQYGPTAGFPPLVQWLKDLNKRLHSPPNWDNKDLIITAGSQDGLCKAIEMLVNTGDYIVTHEPLYTGTLGIMNPLKPRYLPVPCDKDGLIPSKLKEVLSPFSGQEDSPKILYINPNGGNPVGVSISESRRYEIYEIAQKHDLLILEDDPYYFVQFSGDERLVPTFLSLDTDGRVLRFDSFSKILSSGIRLGFVTGPKPLINHIMLHKQVSVLHASNLSQVLVYELLEKWAFEGLMRHVTQVQHFYRDQRDHMLKAAEKHLTGLCEWNIPMGGMFLWIKVPKLTDTWDMIMKKGIKKNVILVPGKAFMTDSDKPCNFMRASFSLVTPKQMNQGLASLAELIREELYQ